MEAHLQSCQDCRLLLRASNQLQRGLRCLQPVEPPLGLSGSIAALVLRDYRLRKRRRQRWLVGSVIAAAALFLVALSNRLVGLFDPQTPEPIHVEIQPQPREENAPVLSLHDSVSNVGSLVVSTASQTADATLAEARHYLQQIPTPSLPPMGPALDLQSRPLREAGESVSDGLAPVTDSARRAVDLFFRELPTLNLDDKAGL
jgi:hypothetical protein